MLCLCEQQQIPAKANKLILAYIMLPHIMVCTPYSYCHAVPCSVKNPTIHQVTTLLPLLKMSYYICSGPMYRSCPPANHRYLWPFTLIITFCRWNSGDNQSVALSVPVVSRWLWAWHRTCLEVTYHGGYLVDSVFCALSAPFFCVWCHYHSTCNLSRIYKGYCPALCSMRFSYKCVSNAIARGRLIF